MSNNGTKSSKKSGALAIFCGIWNMISGPFSVFWVGMMSFDIGVDAYSKASPFFKVLAGYVGWIFYVLSGVCFISSILLFIGAKKLFSDNKNIHFALLGIRGMFIYSFSYCLFAFLIVASYSASFVALFEWLGVVFIVLLPNLILKWALNRNLNPI